jgi:hypothetical protein
MTGNLACEYAICVTFCLKFLIKSDEKMYQTRSGGLMCFYRHLVEWLADT